LRLGFGFSRLASVAGLGKVVASNYLIPELRFLVLRGEDKVVKGMKRKMRFTAYVSILALAAVLLTVPGATRPAMAQSFVHFNPPPFDFNDNFYTANGINVSALDTAPAGRFGLFRQTGPPAFQPGQLNWVVDNSNTDPDRKNVRILATTGGYIDDGSGAPTQFISIIAFLFNQGFFTGVANARGIQMSDIVATFEAYAAIKQVTPDHVFHPTPCGSLGDPAFQGNCFDSSSVATPRLRQDWRFATNRSPIDLSSPFGYFCDDILGMWIITYFWYVDTGFGPHQTTQCNQMLAALGQKNGLTLDGTPIIKTGDELNFLEGKPQTTNPIPGFPGDMPPNPPCAAENQGASNGTSGVVVWLVCPALPDPRNGAIAPDAFLDGVRKGNGSRLDPAFLANFNCLKNTGKFCNE
jgi:hypothetical protein